MTTHREQLTTSEAAGELLYLTVRLLGFVSQLPDRSLPPRGRVQWVPEDLASLSHLTGVLHKGERDAERAISALNEIAKSFQRPVDTRGHADVDGAEAGAQRGRESAQLDQYREQRTVALDSISRLQRMTDSTRAAPPAVRPAPQPTIWDGLAARFRRKRHI
jgi:hypothetical protein